MGILYYASIKTCVVVYHKKHLAIESGSNDGALQVFIKPTVLVLRLSLQLHTHVVTVFLIFDSEYTVELQWPEHLWDHTI